jgi:putative YphP/YqiW family bacilliredoxin
MRRELTSVGVTELMTSEAVDEAMQDIVDKTALVIVNSVCGCAAGNARPAVRMAMHAPIQPDQYLTVFAGQDLEATAKMRAYLQGIPPSSPFLALFKNGQPVFVLERRNIEGRTASAIAYDLAAAYEAHCSNGKAPVVSNSKPQTGDSQSPDKSAAHKDMSEGDESVPKTFRSIL